jgi:phage terminase large subunit-like protein
VGPELRRLAGKDQDRPLVDPDLPLIESEASMGLQFYDELQLPDVPGTPKLRTASGQWFRDIVRAAFGSWDAETQTRYIREIFAMAPKGSSKTSYSAALMLCVMLMNRRPRADALFVGPTQAISDRAYEQAVGMRDASPELRRRFRPRDHIKTIEDLMNGSAMKVKTFDLNILTGSINIFVLLDELHLLGRSAHTTKVLRQIRGGLEKTPEGLLLITTTQSDEPPTGAFKDELKLARKIRDGVFRGKVIRPMLPVLFEFPPRSRPIARSGRIRVTGRW